MMDEYFAVPISHSNRRAMAQMEALLKQEFDELFSEED